MRKAIIAPGGIKTDPTNMLRGRKNLKCKEKEWKLSFTLKWGRDLELGGLIEVL